MADRAFEILLYADIPTAYGGRGRWYLAGANPDQRVAERFFRELCQAFPQQGITIALVLSELNPETGLYHDRVVYSRGRSPLIKRAEMKPLTEQARAEIARALRTRAAPKDLDLGRSRAAAVPSSASAWPWIAAACFAMAVFAALRGGL